MITNPILRSFWEHLRPGWTVLWSDTFQTVTDVVEIVEIDRHVRWYVVRLEEMGCEKEVSWILARFINLKGEFSGFDQVAEGTREALLQEKPFLFDSLGSTTRLADHPYAQEIIWNNDDGSSVRYLQPHPPLAGKVSMFPPLDVEGDVMAFVAKYAIEEGATAGDSELFVFEIGVPDDKGGLIRFLAGSPVYLRDLEFVPPST